MFTKKRLAESFLVWRRLVLGAESSLPPVLIFGLRLKNTDSRWAYGDGWDYNKPVTISHLHRADLYTATPDYCRGLLRSFGVFFICLLPGEVALR